MSDIDAILEKEVKELNKDSEIQRILTAFPLDAYAVLNLQPGCTKEDIRRQYRKLSLLIHPDKTSNPDAPVAFDKLKKAESELRDDKKREILDQAIADARRLLIREKKWTIHDERLKSDDFREEWRDKTRHVLVDNEMRRRKLLKVQLAEEGRQQKRQEEETENRKRKKEAEKDWEETRDERISSWRSFKTKAGKKKKTKAAALG